MAMHCSAHDNNKLRMVGVDSPRVDKLFHITETIQCAINCTMLSKPHPSYFMHEGRTCASIKMRRSLPIREIDFCSSYVCRTPEQRLEDCVRRRHDRTASERCCTNVGDVRWRPNRAGATVASFHCTVSVVSVRGRKRIDAF